MYCVQSHNNNNNNNIEPSRELHNKRVGHVEASQVSSNLGHWVQTIESMISDQFYVETIEGQEIYWKVFVRETKNAEAISFNVTSSYVQVVHANTT